MNELKITCPCCGEEIKISIDSDGNPIAIFNNKENHSPTLSELNQSGIELGVIG